MLEDAERVFADSEDLTIGLEEEFQILDAQTLALTSRFDDLKEEGDRLFGGQLVYTELLRSEAEINSVKAYTFAEARADMVRKRALLVQAARRLGLRLCATGVHPFSRWQDQEFIQSPHYQRVVDNLQYVAWTNNTFALHVHVGVRGPDRAVALHDAFRSFIPPLLALSASSPFYEQMATGLHSTRSQVFIRAFPRCGVPDIYGDWATYADYADFLWKTNSVVEPTQIWWTVRMHPAFGTLEFRATDAQPRFADSMALGGLVVALTATLLDEYDRTGRLPTHASRFIEENRWRALRYGLDGKLIDIDRRAEEPAVQAIRRLLDRAASAADRVGVVDELAHVETMLSTGNSAQRQLELFRSGLDIREIHRHNVAETMGEPAGVA